MASICMVSKLRLFPFSLVCVTPWDGLILGLWIPSEIVNFAAETFINLAKPFIGDTLSRHEIYGTRVEKWKHLMLRKFPADQLPPKYGGTNPDWKPLPFNWAQFDGETFYACLAFSSTFTLARVHLLQYGLIFFVWLVKTVRCFSSSESETK